MTARVLLVLLAVLGAGCGTAGPEEAASPTPSGTVAPTPTPPASPEPEGPVLADLPDGDMSLWATTIGAPVLAAVRTSTPLARLEGAPVDERAVSCRIVAQELDGIASPQVLTALAITADDETATLLVSDLQAKGDLLAACDGGDDVDDLVAEVAHTHQVAVAWLAALREAAS